MTADIKSLPGAAGLPDNPVTIAPRHPGWCDHSAIVLDEHTRTLQCADPKCGAVLDPFDYLRSNARTLQRAWDNYRHVSGQATEVAERVTVLKREEQRLRAMVKRLQEKTGAVVNVRSREL